MTPDTPTQCKILKPAFKKDLEYMKDVMTLMTAAALCQSGLTFKSKQDVLQAQFSCNVIKLTE